MKKIFILLVVLIGISQALMAQGDKSQKVWNEDFKSVNDTAYVKSIAENGDATMLLEIDMPASKLYRYSREWFATKYTSYKESVQLEDKDNGKLIINCKYPVYFKGQYKNDPITMDGVETFKLTCDFKDGRFRIKATEYVVQYKIYLDKFPRDMQMSNSPLTNNYIQAKDASGKPELYELDYRSVLSGMIASMKKYITSADKDDDF